MSKSTQTAPAKPLEITRIFDAPPALVWRAWTDPQQVMRWWGPEHFTSPTCTLDLRVGGKYHFCMQSPDGQKFWTTGNYLEIVPYEKIVCTDYFADEAGNVVPASYYNMPGDWSEEIVITVTFEDLGNQTRMTLRQTDLPTGEMSEMTGQGWNGSFDKLAESVR